MSEFGAKGLPLPSTTCIYVPSWLETCGAFLHVRLKLGAQPEDEECRVCLVKLSN